MKLLTKKQKSQRQERIVAKRLKGKEQPGSGSQFHSKGDVKTDKYLIECKTTEKKSISIKYDILKKIRNESIDEEKIPVLCIEFNVLGKRYYVLEEEDFILL